MRVLPTINGYTIDYRLKEFRRAVPGEELTFIRFETAQGRELLRQVRQNSTLVIGYTGRDENEWVCICGNRPSEDRFLPCNRSGELVARTPATWPEPLYRCGRCGRVIDGDTRAVLSLAA